jgi:hypothetical protein
MLARVYGPATFKPDVHQALGRAGVETAALGDLSGLALREPVEPGVVDVVCLNEGSDGLVVMLKRAQPRRPVLGVVADERSARLALGASWGPDACVVWPATPEALAQGAARALLLAPRPSYLRWPRLLATLSAVLMLAVMTIGVLAGRAGPAVMLTQAFLTLLVSATFFVRIRYAASRRLMLAGGMFFLLGAAVEASVGLASLATG